MGLRAAWLSAKAAARRADPARNRSVDFLRAASILLVVVGHWLFAAPEVGPDGTLRVGAVLTDLPWTRWLTWLLQVMPLFFVVGGFAQAASWRAARRDGLGYARWLHRRVQRLTVPALPLLMVWMVVGTGATAAHLDPAVLEAGSTAALMPVWFVAVYLGVVAMAPALLAAWERYRWVSFACLAVGAGVVDAFVLLLHHPFVGWVNQVLVWAAIHQLGFAWADGRLFGVRRSLTMAAGALVALLVMVLVLGYPVSMIGITGATVNNTLPPKLPLLGVGLLQAGLLLAAERPLRALVARPRMWAATVLVNGRIMTVYLWHLTAMVGVVGVLLAAGGWGLRVPSWSAAWWLTRPLWIALLAVVLLVFLALFGRFEQWRGSGAAPPPWRGVGGVVALWLGFQFVAYQGLVGESGPNLWALALLLAGVVLARAIGRHQPQAGDPAGRRPRHGTGVRR